MYIWYWIWILCGLLLCVGYFRAWACMLITSTIISMFMWVKNGNYMLVSYSYLKINGKHLNVEVQVFTKTSICMVNLPFLMFALRLRNTVCTLRFCQPLSKKQQQKKEVICIIQINLNLWNKSIKYCFVICAVVTPSHGLFVIFVLNSSKMRGTTNPRHSCTYGRSQSFHV